MQPDPKQTILMVDDAPDSLMLIKMLLQGKCRVKLALSEEIALRAADQLPVPDLVLLDVMMPEKDGYTVCRQLKANPLTGDIQVIFLTSKNHLEDQRRGFREGAVDYITKPIDPDVLQAGVSTHLQLKALRTKMKDQYVEQMVEERTRELLKIQDSIVLAAASLAETGDKDARNHLRRTQHYMEALARQLQLQGRFPGELFDENISLMFKAAPLHDIGKMGGADPSLRNTVS
jgi:putative two-component system response regulator